MLGVVRDAGRITVAPDRVDLVDVGQPPVAQRARGTAREPITMPVSSATSRTQVSASGSSARSFEPVTLCQ